MSQENVEIVRGFYAAFNSRAFDAMVPFLDRNVELFPGVMAPDSDSRYLGHDGFRTFIKMATEAWESVTIDATETIETEDGRLLSLDRWAWRGSQDMTFDRELPTLYTFAGGLIVRIDGFTDRPSALRAIGVAE